jgi:hypothetical protein
MKAFVILSLIFWIMNACLGILLFIVGVADDNGDVGISGLSGLIKFVISMAFIVFAICALVWG